jgi:signal transduction histidine kinase
MTAMSLRAKIALGVIAATAILAVALAVLGLQAKEQLDEETRRYKAETQSELDTFEAQTQERFNEFNEQQHRLALRSIEKLVIAQLEPILVTPTPDIAERLRDDLNGIEETGIVTRTYGDTSQQFVDVYKPEKPRGSEMSLTREEQQTVDRVFETNKYEFLGDVLFVPYNPPDSATNTKRLLRLKLDIPPVQQPAPVQVPKLPEPRRAELGPLVVVAFITLALAMLAVFVMLTFALRRFVLAPLGGVLEDSARIVGGTEGLTVKGFKGGKGKDIETLVAAFNAMFSELKAYQGDLEGKVKTATRTIRQQQQNLVIAQRLAATGTLSAGLAHEVNNPLSAMLNAARRLKKKEGLDERARDYIELIEEGLTRIENLMKQILDFSRRRDMKPERFNAEAPLRRAIHFVRHHIEKKHIRLEEDIRNELPEVYGNEEEIGQVLLNLLINATDASPEEGAVRVTIAANENGGVAYSVEDSGEGVPLELRERIFDPFFTTKEPGKGTGLGLAIAHTIIDNHGGTIRVEQGTTLKGARFVVELPKADLHESQRIKEVA